MSPELDSLILPIEGLWWNGIQVMGMEKKTHILYAYSQTPEAWMIIAETNLSVTNGQDDS